MVLLTLSTLEIESIWWERSMERASVLYNEKLKLNTRYGKAELLTFCHLKILQLAYQQNSKYMHDAAVPTWQNRRRNMLVVRLDIG